MSRIEHPPTRQIHLANVFEALSDSTRLEILVRLDALGEATCAEFQDLSSKTNLSYHFARLREAGVTRTRQDGTQRFVSIRRKDLDSRFPGLLDRIVGLVRVGVGIADEVKPGKTVRKIPTKTIAVAPRRIVRRAAKARV